MTAQRKKAYLLVLVLGAAGLLVDRLFLESPISGPEAAVGEQVSRAKGKPPATADSPDPQGIPELPFPSKLQRYSPSERIPDLFADPQTKAERSAEPDKKSKENDGEAAAAQIVQTLQGVFVQDDVQYAIVEGRMLKRGENINGCTLTEISGTRVKFVCVDREVIATVPTSSGPSPR